MTPEFETDLSQYAHLRMILDSVEKGALRHYLNAPSKAEQEANFNYLKTNLMPIHDHVWGNGNGDPVCDPGWILCDGVCIDYACQHPHPKK